jgi:uncharacterized protein YjbJ (UPF0337 family)
MGEFVDKVKGTANEAMGKAKIAIGKGTDHPEMTVKGLVQKAKGKAQNTIGTVKGKLGNRF